MHSHKKACLFFCLFSTIIATTMALVDGDLYKITHSASGNVLTTGVSQPTDGADIILSPWTGSSGQKWLAVQAVVAGDNYLLMPQQQRWDWNRFFKAGESLRETKQRHDSLPDWSLVLNADSTGKVTEQPRDSKPYQQWRSTPINPNNGEPRVIIKNIKENKCLSASGTSSPTNSSSSIPTATSTTTTTTPAPATPSNPGFFGRIRGWFSSMFGSSSSTTTDSSSSAKKSPSTTWTSTSNKVSLVPCDATDEGQQWTLESLPIR